MAAKQTKDTTSDKVADAARDGVNETAATAAAGVALPQAGPVTPGGQASDQSSPAAPAVLAPDDIKDSGELSGRLDEFRAPLGISDLSAASLGGAKETPALPGYLVTDVSSVLHDGTWFRQGDEIFLADKEAAPLLRRRIIEPSRSEQ
ncbi:hypothetical protein [Pseudomonas sp. P42]|uniref:hypothetical protein n=1 Tax=Pseudomonas sp. P42 TaxID=1080160 RepID=UPI001B3300CC|nr:hypothetical protein [Pseudomonas sp. P42]MBP5951313.1 hypothetical protein [Pseudomonas sp. P42]